MNKPKQKFSTTQKNSGQILFGGEYTQRNAAERLLVSDIALFSNVIARTGILNSVIEFGGNIGFNLEAITTLLPPAVLNAVELNSTACREFSERLLRVVVHRQSNLEFKPLQQFDLALIESVLIHINPGEFPKV